MGGTSFETTATGKTAREAFANAVSEAHYWSGHGGYTGTIAEKPGFSEFSVPLADLPPRERPVERWNSEAKAYTTVMEAERITDRLQSAIHWYTENRYEWTNGKSVKVNPFTTVREVTVPRHVKPEEREAYIAKRTEMNERVREDAKFFVTRMGQGHWERLCATYDDKWGNAVAVKVGDEEWLFCGIASC